MIRNGNNLLWQIDISGNIQMCSCIIFKINSSNWNIFHYILQLWRTVVNLQNTLPLFTQHPDPRPWNLWSTKMNNVTYPKNDLDPPPPMEFVNNNTIFKNDVGLWKGRRERYTCIIINEVVWSEAPTNRILRDWEIDIHVGIWNSKLVVVVNPLSIYHIPHHRQPRNRLWKNWEGVCYYYYYFGFFFLFLFFNFVFGFFSFNFFWMCFRGNWTK